MSTLPLCVCAGKSDAAAPRFFIRGKTEWEEMLLHDLTAPPGLARAGLPSLFSLYHQLVAFRTEGEVLPCRVILFLPFCVFRG